VLIAISEEDQSAEEKEIRQMVARQVDGLILASVRPPGDTTLLRELKERKVPCVLIDRKFRGMDVPFVGTDDRAMGAMATEHLIENGCTRIAHLRGPEVSTALLRLKGYQDALKRHNLPARSPLAAAALPPFDGTEFVASEVPAYLEQFEVRTPFADARSV
jgi:LacI family transcriptional regulator